MTHRRSLEEVRWRRAQLVERAAVQRGRVADEMQALRDATAWVDRGAEAIAYLRAHPVALAGIVIVGLVVLRRPVFGGGVARVARRGFIAWRGAVALRALALKLAR